MSGDSARAVTVVIPVWDRYVTYLPEAVASAVEQRAAREVILVDNASAVPLPPLAAVRVVRTQQRLTTGAARNLGLAAVETPFVVFLDADDVMVPGSLEALAEGLGARVDTTAYCMAILVRDTGRRLRAPRGIARRMARSSRLFALANSMWSLLPTQGATIMRTADVRAAGGYADSSQGEEWTLATLLAWRGRVRFSRDPALLFRWTGDRAGRRSSRATLLSNARGVRRRLREDPAVPPLARWLLPVIAVGQWTAIIVVRPSWRVGRLIATRAFKPRTRLP